MPQATICTQASVLTSHMVLRSPPSCYIPKLVYGTAWKKNKTEGLVYKALKYGYRGIDTAAQPKHYDEAGVGAGVKRAIAEDHAHREDLFIQTKFSPPSAQDENTPYDINAPLVDKVHQSIQSSLCNFTVSSDEPYLDSVVMHSPLDTLEETLTVWKTLETYTPKTIRSLGISNTTLPILKAIYENATVKPAVMQNRFHEPTHYEVELRAWCREKGIVFQSFWTVTANPQLVKSSPVQEVAQTVGVSSHVAYISLVMGLKGITVLDGSTKDAHMKANLDGIEKVGLWTQCGGAEKWLSCLQDFKSLINETS